MELQEIGGIGNRELLLSSYSFGTTLDSSDLKKNVTISLLLKIQGTKKKEKSWATKKIINHPEITTVWFCYTHTGLVHRFVHNEGKSGTHAQCAQGISMSPWAARKLRGESVILPAASWKNVSKCPFYGQGHALLARRSPMDTLGHAIRCPLQEMLQGEHFKVGDLGGQGMLSHPRPHPSDTSLSLYPDCQSPHCRHFYIVAFLCIFGVIDKGWDFISMPKAEFQEPSSGIWLISVTLSVYTSFVPQRLYL